VMASVWGSTPRQSIEAECLLRGAAERALMELSANS